MIDDSAIAVRGIELIIKYATGAKIAPAIVRPIPNKRYGLFFIWSAPFPTVEVVIT
jgi:hypothetical protein